MLTVVSLRLELLLLLTFDVRVVIYAGVFAFVAAYGIGANDVVRSQG